MKRIANINDEELRKEQFETLVDIINLIRTKEDLTLFLHSFLSESEQAYLGQRLNIMRMLAKNFNYLKIQELIGTSTGTITNAQKCLDSGGIKLMEIVLEYKFKHETILAEKENPFKSHYPGAI